MTVTPDSAAHGPAADGSVPTDGQVLPGTSGAIGARRGRPMATAARWGGPLVAFALSVGITSAVSSGYWQLELALFAFWAAIGMSWNLIGGYAGQLNLGHAAFIGLGAYGVAFFVVYLRIVPWVGLVVGAVASALMALLLGLATARIRGLYLGMASVALPSMLAVVFQYIQGQFLGFQETPIPASSANPIAIRRSKRWKKERSNWTTASMRNLFSPCCCKTPRKVISPIRFTEAIRTWVHGR